MDKAILVGPDIEEGEKLLNLLDQSDLEVVSAFWYYRSESEVYRLAIVTSFFEKHGPRKTYEKVQSVLRSNPQITISLNEVSAMGPNDKLNTLLKSAISTGSGISGIWFTGNVINGTYIEDAYLYRIN
ncbi:MAG: hypothetical protein WA958_10145 [Tunicatimonas sp.]